MNNKDKKVIIATTIFALLLSGLWVFWIFYMPAETPEDVDDIDRGDGGDFLDNTAACEEIMAYEIIEEPFSSDIPGGNVMVSGTITTEEYTLFGDTFTGIYLAIEPDNLETEQAQEFYDYYVDMAEGGNTINITANDNLFFRLGIVEDGEIYSTANISERAEKDISTSFERGSAAALNMQIPRHLGAGAPPEFTFACAIESAEN